LGTRDAYPCDPKAQRDQREHSPRNPARGLQGLAMMLTGRIWKETKRWWAAEAPIAGVYTQGRSRKDAAAMLADAFESLISRPGFRVTVTDEANSDHVLIEANEPSALAAYVLKYQREVHGLSLAQVAKTLGASSRNAYARYEQGTSVPTL